MSSSYKVTVENTNRHARDALQEIKQWVSTKAHHAHVRSEHFITGQSSLVGARQALQGHHHHQTRMTTNESLTRLNLVRKLRISTNVSLGEGAFDSLGL